MAKIIRFTVSRQLLLQALHIPADATIHQVRDDVNHFAGDLEFYVEHDSLDDVAEGDVIPKKIPMITRSTHVCTCNDEERSFDEYEWDWGIEVT